VSDSADARTSVALTVRGVTNPGATLGELKAWLAAEEELKERVIWQERAVPEAMGAGYDLLVQIGGDAVFTLGMALLHAVRSFRQNRPQEPEDALIIEIVVNGVRLTVEPTDQMTVADLRELAERIQQALG
jgi:hypothetical protein